MNFYDCRTNILETFILMDKIRLVSFDWRIVTVRQMWRCFVGVRPQVALKCL